jgi:septal ring factor EnvC (AmiA/AmiB activator)
MATIKAKGWQLTWGDEGMHLTRDKGKEKEPPLLVGTRNLEATMTTAQMATKLGQFVLQAEDQYTHNSTRGIVHKQTKQKATERREKILEKDKEIQKVTDFLSDYDTKLGQLEAERNTAKTANDAVQADIVRFQGLTTTLAQDLIDATTLKGTIGGATDPLRTQYDALATIRAPANAGAVPAVNSLLEAEHAVTVATNNAQASPTGTVSSSPF